MPPINDTGYQLVLGPDADGRFVTVAQGERYRHPTPPKSVSDLEAEAAAAAAAPDPEPEPPAPKSKPDKEASK